MLSKSKCRRVDPNGPELGNKYLSIKSYRYHKSLYFNKVCVSVHSCLVYNLIQVLLKGEARLVYTRPNLLLRQAKRIRVNPHQVPHC